MVWSSTGGRPGGRWGYVQRLAAKDYRLRPGDPGTEFVEMTVTDPGGLWLDSPSAETLARSQHGTLLLGDIGDDIIGRSGAAGTLQSKV